VDAVHLAPHRRIRVRELECDFLACSPYKFYGPHAGVLWIREEVLEDLDAPRLVPAPNRGPERLESGTSNTEAMAGTTAAVDFLASLVREGDSPRGSRLDLFFSGLREREDGLLKRLWEGLADMEGVGLYGPPPGKPRTPTVSFTVEGHAPRDVASRLADGVGAYLSHGDFYAATVVDRLGLRPGGMVRAGISLYSTEDEVDRLLEGIGEITRRG
jgi:selenocysteine lyase/cysteine desulfurase